MKTIRLIAMVLFMLFNRLHADAAECHLIFEVHSMYSSVFQTRAENFETYFRMASGAAFSGDVLTRSTSVANILALETTFFDSDDDGGSHSSGRYLHLLRIHYGMRDNGQVEMIFEPLYGSTTNPYADPARYDLESTGHYFIIDGTGVVIDLNAHPTLEQGATMIANYQNTVGPLGILIDPDGDNVTVPVARRFLDRTDKYGDAKSIVMPFQEIRFFFADIPTIYFTHVAEWDEQQGVNMLKHAIVMSSAPPSSATSGTQIADLGSLCPVNCGYVTVSGGIMAHFDYIVYCIVKFSREKALFFDIAFLSIIGLLVYRNYKLKKQLEGKS